MKTGKQLSERTLKRLPAYLNFLRELEKQNAEYVSCPYIADSLGLNQVQVRKDLASVSKTAGIPRKGFNVKSLIKDTQACLGCGKQEKAVLVGAGHLGKALLSYNGFSEYGLIISAAFDNSSDVADTEYRGKKIYNLNRFSEYCKENNVKIGIITVPVAYAQEIYELMAESGISAIWNFAPVRLKAKDGILVQNENMISSLAMLSKHLQQNK